MRIKDTLYQSITDQLKPFFLKYITYGSIFNFPDLNPTDWTYKALKSQSENNAGDNGYELFYYYIPLSKNNKNLGAVLDNESYLR